MRLALHGVFGLDWSGVGREGAVVWWCGVIDEVVARKRGGEDRLGSGQMRWRAGGAVGGRDGELT